MINILNMRSQKKPMRVILYKTCWDLAQKTSRILILYSRTNISKYQKEALFLPYIYSLAFKYRLDAYSMLMYNLEN